MFSLIASMILVASALAQDATPRSAGAVVTPANRAERDRRIAAHFAPIFKQGLGDQPRADYITNFDFDGDWKGNNNWENLDNQALALNAWVYFSVIETSTHYFIHYAIFHPRDYKSDLATSKLVEALIRAGVGKLGKDPTGGLADEVSLSHENDLEGCLVVAARNGSQLAKARVQYVETMAHNRFLRYRPAGKGVADYEEVSMKGQHPILFVEPRGHGVSRYHERAEDFTSLVNGVLSYVFAGRAEDPAKVVVGKNEKKAEVGYDLVPIAGTLWIRALAGKGETYGDVAEYSFLQRSTGIVESGIDANPEAPKVLVGSAFLGEVGSVNRAKPPWAWFDRTERERPAGEWFFDPAGVIARHFNLGSEFSRTYTHHPLLAFRASLQEK